MCLTKVFLENRRAKPAHLRDSSEPTVAVEVNAAEGRATICPPPAFLLAFIAGGVVARGGGVPDGCLHGDLRCGNLGCAHGVRRRSPDGSECAGLAAGLEGSA